MDLQIYIIPSSPLQYIRNEPMLVSFADKGNEIPVAHFLVNPYVDLWQHTSPNVASYHVSAHVMPHLGQSPAL